jgi:hypothetical protein
VLENVGESAMNIAQLGAVLRECLEPCVKALQPLAHLDLVERCSPFDSPSQVRPRRMCLALYPAPAKVWSAGNRCITSDTSAELSLLVGRTAPQYAVRGLHDGVTLLQ